MVVNCLTQVLETELSSPEGHLVILTVEPSLWPQCFLLINKSESVLSEGKNEKNTQTFFHVGSGTQASSTLSLSYIIAL